MISSSAFNLNRLAGCSRKTVLKICVLARSTLPALLDTAMQVLFVAGWREDCHLQDGTGPPAVCWPFQITWHLHFPQQWQVRSASTMTVVESSQNCIICYWENKVLSVCSPLGQQLKAEQGVGVGGQPLSEFIHQILMDLIEVLGLYKASWKRPAFTLKNSPWIQTVQVEYGLVPKVHVM